MCGLPKFRIIPNCSNCVYSENFRRYLLAGGQFHELDERLRRSSWNSTASSMEEIACRCVAAIRPYAAASAPGRSGLRNWRSHRCCAWGCPRRARSRPRSRSTRRNSGDEGTWSPAISNPILGNMTNLCTDRAIMPSCLVAQFREMSRPETHCIDAVFGPDFVSYIPVTASKKPSS